MFRTVNQSNSAPPEIDCVEHGPVRPEVIEIFRNGSHDESEQRQRNHQDIFDRLTRVHGRSFEVIFASSKIASNVAALMGDNDPVGWRWEMYRYSPPLLKKAMLEYEAFERKFYAIARKFLPVATEMRDCQAILYDDLDELVKALEPFARDRTRTADPRSEWHSTARFFAERIEAHFKSANLKPPARNSSQGPLILSVQSLLEMVGLRVERETIRKALHRRQSSTRTG